MSNPNFPYLPPACWQDFSTVASKQLQLDAQIGTNLIGFTAQNVIGVPWQTASDGTFPFPPTPGYFSPGTSDDPGNDSSNNSAANILWTVFPNRLSYYNPTMSLTNQFSIGDTGHDTSGNPTPNITKNPCTGTSESLPYGPYGPRGWQDEYCEWCVVYDTENDNPKPGQAPIKRVDFTCENPEYINSVWLIDPTKVVDIYNSALGLSIVTQDDLTLKDPKTGDLILDPATNRPVYNPLNKWNCGPQCTYDSTGNRTSGGAMHLTSTPNTIQTEIAISSYATVPRVSGNITSQTLICCGQFGQPGRNSDPNIGAGINSTINGRLNPNQQPTAGSVFVGTLANPPGLYMQYPDYTKYSWAETGTPFTAEDMAIFFTVKRGYLQTDKNLPAPLASLNNLLNLSATSSPMDFILHLTFEVPEGKSINDILISGQPITWAGQIAQTMHNGVALMAYSTKAPQTNAACVGNTNQVSNQPVQLFHATVFEAMEGTTIPSPTQSTSGAPCLLYNSTFIAPFVTQVKSYPMYLTSSLISPTPSSFSITFYQNGIEQKEIVATNVKLQNDNFSYCVPGNSYPSTYSILSFSLKVGASVPGGIYDLSINGGPVMPALLNVLAFM